MSLAWCKANLHIALAKAASDRMRQEQLDQLKSIENRTGVSHVLVGTYAMRPFRKANAQLAGRSIDVHFPRYDATKPMEAAIFQSVLWALQRQLPVEKEPLLVEKHWEFLYARSIGCIGFLKMHLNLALERVLSEEAATVTEAHLRATAPAEDRVNKWLSEALEGEEELFEKEGADERLLRSLGLRDERKTQKAAETTTLASEDDSASHPCRRRNKPGDRIPGRDITGEHMYQGDDASRDAISNLDFPAKWVYRNSLSHNGETSDELFRLGKCLKSAMR